MSGRGSCCAAPGSGWTAAATTPSLQTPASHFRLGFERVRFGKGDDGDKRVGLVGTSYLIDVVGTSGLAIGRLA